MSKFENVRPAQGAAPTVVVKVRQPVRGVCEPAEARIALAALASRFAGRSWSMDTRRAEFDGPAVLFAVPQDELVDVLMAVDVENMASCRSSMRVERVVAVEPGDVVSATVDLAVRLSDLPYDPKVDDTLSTLPGVVGVSTRYNSPVVTVTVMSDRVVDFLGAVDVEAVSAGWGK